MMRDQFGSIQLLFWNQVNLSKIQTKIMGSFNMVVRVPIKIFMIFGIVKMLQLNTFWNLSKMALTKPYEQIWGKTFYFGTKLFVEHTNVKWRPLEFL